MGWSISSERSIKLGSTKRLKDPVKRWLRRKKKKKVIREIRKERRKREDRSKAEQEDKGIKEKPNVLKFNARSMMPRRL